MQAPDVVRCSDVIHKGKQKKWNFDIFLASGLQYSFLKKEEALRDMNHALVVD